MARKKAAPAESRHDAGDTLGDKVEDPVLPDVSRFPETSWTKEDFLKVCDIAEEELEGLGVLWQEMAAIHDEHESQSKSLRTAADFIVNNLIEVPGVHSVRLRIKSPSGLIRKIIRKLRADSSRSITFDNYKSEITDLIGIRALHLYKGDWKDIDRFIRDNWDLHEQPIAYYRQGDAEDYIEDYRSNDCEVKEHPRKYRSVHYLVKTAPSKIAFIAEVQVRTIYEEAWSEVDHRINYPVAAKPHVQYILSVMNRVSGIADEMSTLANALNEDLISMDMELNRLSLERDEALQELNKTINKLNISKEDREKLKKQLEAASSTDRRLSNSISSPVYSALNDMAQRAGMIQYHDYTSELRKTLDRINYHGHADLSKAISELRKQITMDPKYASDVLGKYRQIIEDIEKEKLRLNRKQEDKKLGENEDVNNDQGESSRGNAGTDGGSDED